jgi:hypothetical protein
VETSARFAAALRPAAAASCNVWQRAQPPSHPRARKFWLSSLRNRLDLTEGSVRESSREPSATRRERRGSIELIERQSDVAERHGELIRDMPLQLRQLVKTVEEIQDKKHDAEQHDAAANEAMT